MRMGLFPMTAWAADKNLGDYDVAEDANTVRAGRTAE